METLSKNCAGSTLLAPSRRDIAEAHFATPIHWIDHETGYLLCPGKHLHSTPDGKRDCRLKLFPPTLFCFHSQCTGHNEQIALEFCRNIGKAERGGEITKWTPSPEELKAQRQREREKQRKATLERRAKDGLRSILERHAISERDFIISSPHTLDCVPGEDWKRHLLLWKADDVIWIGNVTDSGSPRHEPNFRTRDEWLKESSCPGNFTCPSTFKNNICSRSNENAIGRPFLVVESDTLPRGDMRAVIQWLRLSMRLRAVVDTGGKSLHGWFEYPNDAALTELKAILPTLGCDPALFKASQPCRLPGAWRAEKQKWQNLIWLELKGGK
jgi:hypothetical protein